MELAALYTKAAQQFEVAARLDDRDFDAVYNRAHCVLMAEIVMVVHGDGGAASAAAEAAEDVEREAKAERFRNSSGAGTLSVSTLAVPPRKMSASLDVDPTCDAARLGELRRKAAVDACELAQTLCEQAVQLEIAASGVDPVGDELPARAVALARLKNALEQDAASALKISGRRSPRSERRRERSAVAVAVGAAASGAVVAAATRGGGARRTKAGAIAERGQRRRAKRRGGASE
jgi:hypothetical protein